MTSDLDLRQDSYESGDLEDQFPDSVVGGSEPVRIRLDQVRGPDFALRLGPIRDAHVAWFRRLNGNWPPILVSRNNYSLIDGYYRLVAAQQLGYTEVTAYLFDGPSDAAYLEALRRNMTRGLPLTLREREHAASCILEVHLDWSDRRIAELCLLAPSTISRLRSDVACPTVQNEQLDKREGKDDRHRPVDPAGARFRVREAVLANPGASLREIARLVECSPETVRTVRGQLAIARQNASSEPSLPDDQEGRHSARSETIDRALNATDDGAAFVTWFTATAVSNEDCFRHLTSVPLSRVYEIADEARRRANIWITFARDLENRTSSAPVKPRLVLETG